LSIFHTFTRPEYEDKTAKTEELEVYILLLLATVCLRINSPPFDDGG